VVGDVGEAGRVAERRTGARRNELVGGRFGIGDAVRIADFSEAERFGGRFGIVYGLSIPSSSGIEPILGRSREDSTVAVYFEETAEYIWFEPYLVERVA
jgi:hypothetical protein